MLSRGRRFVAGWNGVGLRGGRVGVCGGKGWRGVGDWLGKHSAPMIYPEQSALAAEVGAVNLGQGFADWETDVFVQEALGSATQHAYSPPKGHPALIEALCATYTSRYGREVRGEEVGVAMGATGGIFSLMHALVQSPGDEVVIVEPAYDCYAPAVESAGGRVVRVQFEVEGATMRLDVGKICEAVGAKTKAVILNTPHNPSGVMLSESELRKVGEAVGAVGGVVVVDEVYDALVYDGKEHVYAGGLSGLEDVFVSVSGLGKGFGVTGWRVGWVVGRADVVQKATLVNQWAHFCVPTPIQVAAATCLTKAPLPYTDPTTSSSHPSYYSFVASLHESKRNTLLSLLHECGFSTSHPPSGLFVLATPPPSLLQHLPTPYLSLTSPAAPHPTTDTALARWLLQEAKVAAIPPSVLFHDHKHKHKVGPMLRFAFCKKDQALQQAREKLLQFVQQFQQ